MNAASTRVQMFVTAALAFALALGLVYPAKGQAPAPDLDKQVAVLRKVVEDQNKQLVKLQADFDEFKKAQTKWDKDLVVRVDNDKAVQAKWNSDARTAIAQDRAAIAQDRTAIANIQTRLQRAGIP